MTPESWLSILGAITGLTALCLQLWQFALGGARIKVTASQGFSVNTFKQVLIIQVINRGRIAATVQHVSVELGWDGSHIPLAQLNQSVYIGPDSPIRIEHLAHEVWSVPIAMILEAQTENGPIHIIRALVTLSNGKKRRSRKFEIRQDGTGGPIYSRTNLLIRKIWRLILRKTRGRNMGRANSGQI